MRRRVRGFTLIELLIVVAIIGIIVAMGIMNLISAIQRAKQKRTMGDQRQLGNAIEAYAVDYNRYPAAAAAVPGVSLPFAIPSSTIVSGNAVQALQPTYLRMVPVRDGWANYYYYGTGNGQTDYMIVSGARNAALESTVSLGPTTSYNSDIIFADGQFFAWPEGAQTE